MLRPRFIVVYQDRRLPLPDGEILVGRALGCHIRFNAPEVSRQHVRLVVRGGRLTAENLSGTTGTALNGRRITAPTALSHGDELVLGPRRIRIEVEDAAVGAPLGPAAAGDPEPPPDDEATRPGEIVGGVVTIEGVPTATIESHTCPRCRARNDFRDSTCAACGYAWSASHPSAVTQRITLTGLPTDAAVGGVAGRAPAPPAEVPVVYASEELTIDALVAELGEDGAFVPSPLLDAPGTACELTLLPDGTQAMTVAATVVAVRAVADAAGVPGMQLRFVELPAPARAWIARWRADRGA